MSIPPKMLDYALAYLRKGYSPFPLCDKNGAPTKEPYWAKEKSIIEIAEAPILETQVIDWWTKYPRANIGLFCGPLPWQKEAIVVLDYDPRQASVAETNLQEALTILKNTTSFQATTGQQGGTHFYYKYNNVLEWSPRKFHRIPKQGPLTIQKGKGLDLPWYVVAPPSLHPTRGVYYGWVNKPIFSTSPGELPELPSEFFLFEAGAPSKKETLEKLQKPYWISDLLLQSQQGEGCRNISTAKLAGALLEYNPYDIVVSILKIWNRAQNKIPLSEKEIERTVFSVANTRKKNNAWEKPLRQQHPRVLFPVDEMFGDIPAAHQFVESLSKGCGIDPSMVGPAIFSGVSTCMLQRYRIRVDEGWEIPPTFALLCGADTGSQKGSVYTSLMEALYPSILYQEEEYGSGSKLENRNSYCKSYTSLLAKKDNERVARLAGAPAIDWGDTVSNDSLDEAIVKLRMATSYLNECSKKPTLFHQKGSVEALQDLLSFQKKTNMYYEEGRSFFEFVQGGYSDITGIDIIISGLDGRGTRRLTLKSDSTQSIAAEINIFILIQPLIFANMTAILAKKGQDLEEQGLFPRFLFSFPSSEFLVRKEDQEHYESIKNYAIKNLGDLFLEITRAPEKRPKVYSNSFLQQIAKYLPDFVNPPQIITFEPSAKEAIKNFQQEMSQWLKDGNSYSTKKNWGRRAHEKAAKIAAFLHMLREPGTHKPVPLDLAKRAIWFMKTWAIPHMFNASSFIKTQEDIKDASFMWKVLVPTIDQRDSSFTFSYEKVFAITQNYWPEKREMRERKALEILKKMNFIRPKYPNLNLIHPKQEYECHPEATF